MRERDTGVRTSTFLDMLVPPRSRLVKGGARKLLMDGALGPPDTVVLCSAAFVSRRQVESQRGKTIGRYNESRRRGARGGIRRMQCRWQPLV